MNHFRVAAAAFLFAIAAPTASGSSDRHVFFVSDLHMGRGVTNGEWARIEDFRWLPALRGFLAHANTAGGGKADLVMLGDVFELWQSPFMTCSAQLTTIGCKTLDCSYDDPNLGCNEADALRRLGHVLNQHKDAIAALDGFASQGSNTVTIVPGNHDAALLLPRLREAVERVFKRGRVTVSRVGYWTSEDLRIYGDHGHQFDDVNRWEHWPKPTVTKGGVEYLRRPWGENMVQEFYNQYEEAFPVIDNFLDEKEGVYFAIEQVGIAPAAEAVGRFLRFFLFQQSLKQAGVALDDGKSPWDIEETRTRPPSFFSDVLASDPRLKRFVERAHREQKFALNAMEMSEAELRRICDLKAALSEVEDKTITPCTKRTEHLGAALRSVMFSPEEIRRDYLRGIAKDLYGNKKSPDIYVYGHTHRAVPPSRVEIGELLSGPSETIVVNDGAFQRVATEAQVIEALKSRRVKMPGATLADLTPDDLPDCHTFVSIAPYKEKPVARLRHILGRDGGKHRKIGDGVCPGN